MNLNLLELIKFRNNYYFCNDLQEDHINTFAVAIQDIYISYIVKFKITNFTSTMLRICGHNLQ